MDIGIYEAKTHFAQLMERVEKGEHVTITRRGKRIAEIRPAQGRDQARLEAALKAVEAMREANKKKPGHKPITVAEIIAAKNEGRP